MPAAASTLPEGLGVVVRSPASSANLGPGFDTIGLALGLWDEYRIDTTGQGLHVEVDGEDAADVPRGPEHLVVRCLLAGLEHLGVAAPAGLRLSCVNGVPHSRGLGSSATAAVAGLAAATALVALASTGTPTIDRALVNDLAAQLEGHPDNSSASVYGGLTVSWNEDPGAAAFRAPVHTARLAVHPDVVPVALVPDTRLATSTARAALPAAVPLRRAAAQAGRSALLVEAMTRTPELLLPATVDLLHQEQRRGAYPASMALVDALRRGGHAAVVSGAGPTVLVLATRSSAAEVAATPLPEGWRAVQPGIAGQGVAARQA